MPTKYALAKRLIAQSQFQLVTADLEVVLAMTRAGTLAAAGERLVVDPSTVFRSLQRIERGLGQPLFKRSRTGYVAMELALALAEHAESVEATLELARSAAHSSPGQVVGTVRITTTDTILHGLVAPALKELRSQHPLLAYELHTANELASLTQRDADIAVRATKRPPQHLVGKHVGPIRLALYAARSGSIKRYADVEAGQATWIAPDDALPEHDSVLWRKRHFPKVAPGYRVNSILTVMELVAQGLGVGVLPIFLTQARKDLLQLTDVIDDFQTELWLLTHKESRHVRRISTVYAHLARQLKLL